MATEENGGGQPIPVRLHELDPARVQRDGYSPAELRAFRELVAGHDAQHASRGRLLTVAGAAWPVKEHRDGRIHMAGPAAERIA